MRVCVHERVRTCVVLQGGDGVSRRACECRGGAGVLRRARLRGWCLCLCRLVTMYCRLDLRGAY